jgi:hypothetical protein
MKNDVVILHTYPPMKMEQTECSETSAYKIQTPGNYPEESILVKRNVLYIFRTVHRETNKMHTLVPIFVSSSGYFCARSIQQ